MTGIRLVVVVVLAVAMLVGCASESVSPLVEGQAVYVDRCYACHGLEGEGTAAGPSISDSSEESIRAAITEGVDTDPDHPAMAAVPMTPRQIDVVVTYLAQLNTS